MADFSATVLLASTASSMLNCFQQEQAQELPHVNPSVNLVSTNAWLTCCALRALQEAWDTSDDAESGSELESAESSLSSYTGSLGGAWWQKFFEVCFFPSLVHSVLSRSLP